MLLAFVRGIHQGPVNYLHKWPVTRKIFPFNDVIMFCDLFIRGFPAKIENFVKVVYVTIWLWYAYSQQTFVYSKTAFAKFIKVGKRLPHY